MSKPSEVIVLCEDRRHQNFVRRYLEKLKIASRGIRFEALPNSRGCGEQWVRERYPEAVAAYRHRSKRAATRLVVVIDADVESVEHRRQQLAQTLSQARTSDEKIAHLIPKRNIETWVLCLTSLPVDEITDYSKRSDIDELIKPAAETLFEWTRPNAPVAEHRVDSLSAAMPELKRLDP